MSGPGSGGYAPAVAVLLLPDILGTTPGTPPC